MYIFIFVIIFIFIISVCVYVLCIYALFSIRIHDFSLSLHKFNFFGSGPSGPYIILNLLLSHKGVSSPENQSYIIRSSLMSCFIIS